MARVELDTYGECRGDVGLIDLKSGPGGRRSDFIVSSSIGRVIQTYQPHTCLPLM